MSETAQTDLAADAQQDDRAPIVLVTGASRGLGFASAVGLGARGAQVIALARTVGGLEEADDAIRGAGGRSAVLVPLDLAKTDELDQLGPVLAQRYARIDMLVHAAAQSSPLAPLSHAAEKDMRRAMEINVTALWRLMRTVEPLMRRSETPQAVFFEDPAVGQAFWGVYGASKAAASAMARSYAAENPWLNAHFLTPPPMPTALRARTHPGEDRAPLTPPAVVAESVVSTLLGPNAAAG